MQFKVKTDMTIYTHYLWLI